MCLSHCLSVCLSVCADEWMNSPEMVFATQLAPDHSISLRIPQAEFSVHYELKTAPVSATDAACPGTEPRIVSDGDW